MAEAGELPKSGEHSTPDEHPKPGAGCSVGGCGRIDTHAHYLPSSYRQALKEAGLNTVDGGVPLPPWSLPDHVAMMDQNRIGASILSLSSPGVQFLEGAAAAKLARSVNEDGAEAVRAHPDRFGLFISLPLPDVEASLQEIKYGFEELGADGVVLMTNSKGVYPGAPELARVFEELDRRSAVVYLHPTSPCGIGPAAIGLPAPFIEFPFDTVRAAVNLVYSGVLKRCPRIKLLLSHAGGALPMLASRVAAMSMAPIFEPRPAGGAEEVTAQLAAIYYDLALAANPIAFNALRGITAIDHITFGTDYPFSGPGLARHFAGFEAIKQGLSEIDQAKVERLNALQLFPRLRAFLQE
jgi:predicted TIM-barrel fold metal-dependent hydrolase